MKDKILIVEDQFVEANNLRKILDEAEYCVVGIARSVAEAQDLLDRKEPDFVLIDIFLKGPETGIDLAARLRSRRLPFIYISANSNRETLLAAKRTRPYGFLVKPFRKEDVLVTLEIGRYLHEFNAESPIYHAVDERSGIKERGDPGIMEIARLPDIVGSGPTFRNMVEQARLVAPFNTTVLLLGESGTGKEVLATAIHNMSSRAKGPLVKVNCAALPTTLVESILFGHEKGSFTGATERRIGKFEQAHGGTIILDEVGEMPPDMQIKLLRALQEKEIERIGACGPVKIDVRVIASTNKDLEKEVAEGRFRLDLYYRLNAFPLTLPPLRERKEDIPLLAVHFVSVYSGQMGKPKVVIAENVMEKLLAHPWPGNIRELEHIIERSLILCKGTTLDSVQLDERLARNEPAPERLESIEENERNHILAALKECNGKVFGAKGAAQLLSIHPSTLYSRMKKMGICLSRVPRSDE